MSLHKTDQEPLKCRRRGMFTALPRASVRAPLGAACATGENHVAPTGLHGFVHSAFYKHAAPTALETAKGR
jgi:hypothetical protein